MTPRRLDPDSVTAKLLMMREALDVLDGVGQIDAEALRADAILRGAVERYLILLVDLAVAVNLHLVAAAGRPVARDYTASFTGAAEVGAIVAARDQCAAS
jgi:uncharacterized protein YutE (UPF0331/DUF86 family)